MGAGSRLGLAAGLKDLSDLIEFVLHKDHPPLGLEVSFPGGFVQNIREFASLAQSVATNTPNSLK